MKQVAVIGCGARVQRLMQMIAGAPGVRIKGGYDPDAEQVTKLPLDGAAPVVYPSYQEVVTDPEIDWVVVGSPNAFHKEHIVAAFDQGKHVFAEKPLATTVDDCVRIYRRSLEAGVLFATGFTLRYATIYRRAKELIESEAI